MARIEKTVFISYRRKDQYAGLAVYQDLTSRGYDVFLDYTSIPSGDFEQNIVSNIRARAHFILILTPTALDRCSEAGDWLRREVETAIDEKRNIIPLFFDGFNFNSPAVVEKLTGKLALLSRYNGLDVPSGYFMEAMERLRSRYLNVPLTVVLHPMPTEVKEVVKGEQIAADKALEQKKDVIEELIKPAEDKPEHGTSEINLQQVKEAQGNIKKELPHQSGILETATGRPLDQNAQISNEQRILKKPDVPKKGLDSTIIAALIGAIGTVAVALITIFANKQPSVQQPTPVSPTTVLITETIIPTASRTDIVPTIEPTSTPVPSTDTPEPTATFTVVPPVALGEDWKQGCISSSWIPYPSIAVTARNGCLSEPVHGFAADSGVLSFLDEQSGPIPVEYYGLFAPLPEKGTVTFKVRLKDLENVDLWMGVFPQPDIKSNGLLITIPAGDVERRVIVQKEVLHYQTIFSTRDLIDQGDGHSFTFIFDTLSATGKLNPFVLTTSPASIPVNPKWLYLGYKSLGGYHRVEGVFFNFVITSD